MTMRFATSGSQPASLDAHGNTKRQRSCSHYTAICNQRVKKRIELRTHEQPLLQNTEEEPIALGSTAAAPAAHTRYLSSPAGATLHGKTQGFLPRLSPKTKPMSHPCSHDNAFCNFRFPTCISRRTWQHKTTTIMDHAAITLRSATRESRKRIELRTHEQPLIAEHRGGTNRAWFDRSRTRRTHEVPFIAGRSHFTRKNTRFPAPAFPQNKKPMSHPCSHDNAFCNFRFPTRISRRTWQHKTTTIMQPLHCDL